MRNLKKIIGGFLVAGMFVLFGCGGGGGGSATTSGIASTTSSGATTSQSKTIQVVSTGSGAYSILGNNMDGVAGIQIEIKYDTASLSTPTVTQGGLVAGAMLAANTSTAGVITIGIINASAFSGNGQLAGISFASKTGSAGITSITTSLIDIKGLSIASSATVSN
jgi:hypothetical protein